MGVLGKELLDHTDEIVQRWYEVWRKSTSADPSVSEAALKDDLPEQLKIVGKELQHLQSAEDPAQMWKAFERLDPEKRVDQHTPIQEVVQEYALAVRTVRDWVEERNLAVDFGEYSYFYESIFELTAESVRRYAERQAELIRHDRAHYLAGVMHQLRTPLSALAMQTELAVEDMATLDENFVIRQQRNVHRIEALVNRILRLERFLPGEFPVHPEGVFPARLIDEIMSDQQKAAASKALRLEAHVDRSLRMKVDPGLFYDVLGNILDNAIKYTERGYVIVEAEERPDTVVFRVRDTGPGITPEQQKSLFKEQQPAHAGGGIGIGLQIAQHAVEAQGGTIAVDSEPGKGSTFTVCLPKKVAGRDGR